MKFNIRALALASAILWGGCVLLVGVANLICAGYGQHFLEMLSSFYPATMQPAALLKLQS